MPGQEDDGLIEPQNHSGWKRPPRSPPHRCPLPTSLSATSPRLWNTPRDGDPPPLPGQLCSASPLFGEETFPAPTAQPSPLNHITTECTLPWLCPSKQTQGNAVCCPARHTWHRQPTSERSPKGPHKLHEPCTEEQRIPPHLPPPRSIPAARLFAHPHTCLLPRGSQPACTSLQNISLMDSWEPSACV